jgi:release factor glutamine methyltransferase
LTIEQALQKSMSGLADAGVETPRFDAQLLMAWTIKGRREDLAREPERVLTEREALIFEKAVSLRRQRRPLAYITGEQWFFGRSFKINRAVLIPRPETEMLVSAALDASQETLEACFADIGTGSGILAVTLACERPDARIWATDLSGDALKTARKNVARYCLEDRIRLAQGDLLAPLPRDRRFDVIVSNPPYIRAAEMAELQPEVRDYEPALALSGLADAAGEDGAALHRRLLTDAGGYLKSGGFLILEVGLGQAQTVAGEALRSGWIHVGIRNDLSGIERVVQAQHP